MAGRRMRDAVKAELVQGGLLDKVGTPTLIHLSMMYSHTHALVNDVLPHSFTCQ
jgi:hypothetical protein